MHIKHAFEKLENMKKEDKKQLLPKMSPTVHNSPEFKEARKTFQGINSTPKKALEKSKRRMAEKMAKRSPIVREGLNT